MQHWKRMSFPCLPKTWTDTSPNTALVVVTDGKNRYELPYLQQPGENATIKIKKEELIPAGKQADNKQD